MVLSLSLYIDNGNKKPRNNSILLVFIEFSMTADTFHKASPMEHLAEKLANDVQTLSKYLHSTGQPSPSFDQSSPSVVLPEGTPEHVQIARDHVMDYALQIFQLAAGPSEYLANLQTGVRRTEFSL